MKETHKNPAQRQGGYFFGIPDSMTDEEIREQWPAMVDDEETPAARGSLYEFRVTGPTHEIAWEDWFDATTVTSSAGQITVLRSKIADQAALYGMLSRLREVGLTLQSVTRLDSSAGSWWPPRWKTIRVHLARTNWGLVIAYLLIAGALSPLTVALSQVIDSTLAIMALFGALAGVAYGFSQLDQGVGWRVMTGLSGFTTVLILVIYLTNDAGVSVGLALGLLALLIVGLAIWLMVRFGLIHISRPVTRRQTDRLAGAQIALYEIRVRGRLDSAMWRERFAGMALTTQDDGITVLRGAITSPAALYHLLASLRDLALPLVSVTQIPTLDK